jgi:hypothetical protein
MSISLKLCIHNNFKSATYEKQTATTKLGLKLDEQYERIENKPFKKGF